MNADDWHKLADERAAALVQTLADLDRRIADLTREWSAHAVTRQELAASRSAHELCMKERDALKLLLATQDTERLDLPER